MMGCPYAQELELLSTDVTLWGQDFFWTIAKPLTDFDPDGEAFTLAMESWKQYLQEGQLSRGQVSAQTATGSTEFLESLKHK